jgi:hypothetical protein
MTRSARKTFYVTFKDDCPLSPYYTTVEANHIQDARIYADTFWWPYVKTVESSGQFWLKKRTGKYTLLPNNKAEQYDQSNQTVGS